MLVVTEQEGPAGAGAVENPPDPSALVESLRAFGYGFDAAVCDIVDNSLAAKAKQIVVDVCWDGQGSRVSVADDGSGMSGQQLLQAMRLGAHSPLEVRREDDLGRFGLGLKTASFSQCRRLTVATRDTDGGDIECAVWDLDVIAQSGSWLMGRTPTRDAADVANRRLKGRGTLVVWEQLDRLVGDVEVNDTAAHDHLLRRTEGLMATLGMVYSQRLVGRSALSMHVNENPVQGWDPFLDDHEATQRLPLEHLRSSDGRTIPVQAFVLPHHSRLTRAQFDRAAGPHGWNEHQGFFVYRNGRLLVSGGWLDLGYRKEDHYKLARVRIDIGNAEDHAWKIDVRKQIASVPDVLLPDLRRIAKAARKQAEQVYRHRGKIIAKRGEKDTTFVWQAKRTRGRTRYVLNRRHPLVEELRREAGTTLVTPFLKLVEETMPVTDIALDVGRSPESVVSPFDKSAEKEVLDIARAIYEVLRKRAGSHRVALSQLAAMEPAASRPELVAIIDEEATQ